MYRTRDDVDAMAARVLREQQNVVRGLHARRAHEALVAAIRSAIDVQRRALPDVFANCNADNLDRAAQAAAQALSERR